MGDIDHHQRLLLHHFNPRRASGLQTQRRAFRLNPPAFFLQQHQRRQRAARIGRLMLPPQHGCNVLKPGAAGLVHLEVHAHWRRQRRLASS